MTTENKATENAIRLIKKEIANLYKRGDHYPYYSEKLAKWSVGFTVEELPNGKPAIIRQATSSADYVYYLAFLLKTDEKGRRYRRINGGGWFKVGLYLTATENGNSKKLNFSEEKYLDQVWTNSDAESIRKNADKVFLIKARPLYSEEDEKKQESRRQNPAPKTRAQYEKDCHIFKVDRTLSKCKDAPDNAFYYCTCGGWYGLHNEYYDRSYNNITKRREELRRKYAEVMKERKAQELKTRNNSAERLEALAIVANCEKYYNEITFADILENPKNEQFKNELATVGIHAKKFISKIDAFPSVEDMLAKFNEIKNEYMDFERSRQI